mmetsp:Transcript_13567/g.26165  ORF Transcript_13567/g.26165 Transcript_13567/m.26165 type:complete len:80 (+) Transcript_13567:668-907(+)
MPADGICGRGVRKSPHGAGPRRVWDIEHRERGGDVAHASFVENTASSRFGRLRIGLGNAKFALFAQATAAFAGHLEGRR